jgi:hypothetical protein
MSDAVRRARNLRYRAVHGERLRQKDRERKRNKAVAERPCELFNAWLNWIKKQ